MNYQQFLQEIESKCAGKKKLQLDNFTNYCQAAGNPEQSLRGIHIGGTNGKGSTSAMVESILHAHGFSTGLNTSPHLVNYKERFRINKQELPEEKILDTYLQFRDLHQQFDTSFFEISTALAFQMFYDEKVDYTIAEVGMGGRLDATKLINSKISAITSIDYDHTKSLGNTLGKIAWQKAGIIKPQTPVVTGNMAKAAATVISREAALKRAPVLTIRKECKINIHNMTPAGSRFDCMMPKYQIALSDLFCNMAGVHQIDNAALALLICAEIAAQDDWTLKEHQTKKALANVVWQGRMQTISENPKIIIDGAHNPAGVQKLVFNLTNIYDYNNLICVVAILFDKDFKLMIQNLSQVVDTFIVSQSKSGRTGTTKDLFTEALKYKNVIAKESIEEAIATAKTLAEPGDMICITGSLYTIKEVLKGHQTTGK